jgi:hypothetical protein
MGRLTQRVALPADLARRPLGGGGALPNTSMRSERITTACSFKRRRGHRPPDYPLAMSTWRDRQQRQCRVPLRLPSRRLC